jgi:uncharacterized protein with GYD domain
MLTYVSFMKWTDQGVATVEDSPARAEAARSAIESMGGKMTTLLYSPGEGDFDIIAITEFPNEVSAGVMGLVTRKLGNATINSVRVFTEGEFDGILSNLPQG